MVSDDYDMGLSLEIADSLESPSFVQRMEGERGGVCVKQQEFCRGSAGGLLLEWGPWRGRGQREWMQESLHTALEQGQEETQIVGSCLLRDELQEAHTSKQHWSAFPRDGADSSQLPHIQHLVPFRWQRQASSCASCVLDGNAKLRSWS